MAAPYSITAAAINSLPSAAAASRKRKSVNNTSITDKWLQVLVGLNLLADINDLIIEYGADMPLVWSVMRMEDSDEAFSRALNIFHILMCPTARYPKHDMPLFGIGPAIPIQFKRTALVEVTAVATTSPINLCSVEWMVGISKELERGSPGKDSDFPDLFLHVESKSLIWDDLQECRLECISWMGRNARHRYQKQLVELQSLYHSILATEKGVDRRKRIYQCLYRAEERLYYETIGPLVVAFLAHMRTQLHRLAPDSRCDVDDDDQFTDLIALTRCKPHLFVALADSQLVPFGKEVAVLTLTTMVGSAGDPLWDNLGDIFKFGLSDPPCFYPISQVICDLRDRLLHGLLAKTIDPIVLIGEIGTSLKMWLHRFHRIDPWSSLQASDHFSSFDRECVSFITDMIDQFADLKTQLAFKNGAGRTIPWPTEEDYSASGDPDDDDDHDNDDDDDHDNEDDVEHDDAASTTTRVLYEP